MLFVHFVRQRKPILILIYQGCSLYSCRDSTDASCSFIVLRAKIRQHHFLRLGWYVLGLMVFMPMEIPWAVMHHESRARKTGDWWLIEESRNCRFRDFDHAHVSCHALCTNRVISLIPRFGASELKSSTWTIRSANYRSWPVICIHAKSWLWYTCICGGARWPSG